MFVCSVSLPYIQSLTDEFYYRYHLLDNEMEITSEMFKAPNFKAEKASIRILCTRGRLSELFSSRPSMQVIGMISQETECTRFLLIFLYIEKQAIFFYCSTHWYDLENMR